MFRRRILLKIILMMFVLPIALYMISCQSSKELSYYAEKQNYITATGKVFHIKYNENGDVLYLGINVSSTSFSDVSFRIVGESLLRTQERGIDSKLQLGDEVSFVAAPRYWGDGYVVPIVEIIVGNEELLEFEEGFNDLQEWLANQ